MLEKHFIDRGIFCLYYYTEISFKSSIIYHYPTLLVKLGSASVLGSSVLRPVT
jgi:hypothetical protein